MFLKQPERLYAAKHSWISLSVAYINHISIILHAAENESIHRSVTTLNGDKSHSFTIFGFLYGRSYITVFEKRGKDSKKM